jgi:serine phosphatase RsbU (regulator of sigma subunit)
MLGAFIDAPFTQVEREFVPGDRLFLFTDGLIESVPHFFTMKGPEVISTLQTMPEQPIENIVATFRSALPGGCFTDDVTLMSILFLPEASHG